MSNPLPKPMRWRIQPAREVSTIAPAPLCGCVHETSANQARIENASLQRLLAGAASAELLIATRGEGEATEIEIPLKGKPAILRQTNEDVWFTLKGHSTIFKLPKNKQTDTATLLAAVSEEKTITVIRGMAANEAEQCDECEEPDLRTDRLSQLEAVNVAIAPASLSDEMMAHLLVHSHDSGCNLANECIPFAYPDFGCEARAHRACRLLSQRPDWKQYLFKVCCVRADTRPVCTENHPTGQVIWNYHIAAAIKVEASPNQPQTMILDPSLFRCAKTLEIWEKRVLNGVARAALHEMPIRAVAEKDNNNWWYDDTLSWGDAELNCQRLNLELRALHQRRWPPYANIACE